MIQDEMEDYFKFELDYQEPLIKDARCSSFSVHPLDCVINP